MPSISRRAFVGSATLAGAALAACAGCAQSKPASESAPASSGQISAGNSQGQKAFTVGTLATEDILPFWIAQERNLFAEAALDVQIVTFQSATELIAGVGSGDVDLAMTDIMVAASMFAGGTDIKLSWVTLGTEADQGRFGIMVRDDSEVRTLKDLAGVPIGVGSNTILEYVMDKLMEQAGVDADQIVVEELQKLPVRFQALQSGDVAAAALPGSLLALGEASGCRTVADDTQGANISQSVMIVRTDVADDPNRGSLIEELKDIWNEAATIVNDDPEACRQTLVANANLSDAVADTYPISTYPLCELPSKSMVAPILEWMQEKGYLSTPLSYDEKTGAFEAA